MIDQVRPSEVPVWLRAHGVDAIVLDVRENAELNAASVKPEGFALVHIPMNEIPGRLGQLDPGRAVAVLCHHGTRSMRVAMFLQANGFETVANIAGGIEAWSQELDPSVPRY
ncbi:MAG TPA: rhodanese-like domain-containing protein [Ramlibacter sp.]|nr:rhodanese-like domain-containing protein [Ramlibacter sp.]